MKTIDIHAHFVPRSMWNAIENKKEWFGFRHEGGAGAGTVVGCGLRTHFTSDKVRYTPEQRLKDMDADGTDVQVLSIHPPFYGYNLDLEQGQALARDANEEVAGMMRQWPTRFSGFATLPLQDVNAAIKELEHAVTKLGLKGAELDTNVNGEQWDDPKFLPFFKAAEAMGTMLFFHPQPQNNFLMDRVPRYRMSNSLGVILDDAIVAAVLICGGVLEKCPDLKICIAHGGGPLSFCMGRLDRGWQGLPANERTPKPPSAYQRQMYFDTVVSTEAALRFLIDQVGVDRVVLGSDWPFVKFDPSPGGWVKNMKSLTDDEKEKILWRNVESALKL
jgi:aminocarboxymuconate-semialdehyde decarboxylase